MTTNITVVGAGAWGTTLATILAKKGYLVRLWVREEDLAIEMRGKRVNSRFLPGITLPATLLPTADLHQAITAAELLIMAVPSRWMRSSARALAAVLPADSPPLISVTKGLEIETGKRMSQIITEEIPCLPAIAALSGPNLAPEIARGEPAATVIASRDAALATHAREIFTTPNLRPYSSADIIGLECCGAIKNVIALAAGICEGMGYGDNAKASLLTRSIAEIGRLVFQLGGQAETVSGLSGIGDLIATCASPMSRNHRVGLAIGRGEDYRNALGDSGQVAEGVPTTEAAVKLARKLGVDMPICEQVYAILHEGRPVAEAVEQLMGRTPKWETAPPETKK